jgi:hypothetical protein
MRKLFLLVALAAVCLPAVTPSQAIHSQPQPLSSPTRALPVFNLFRYRGCFRYLFWGDLRSAGGPIQWELFQSRRPVQRFPGVLSSREQTVGVGNILVLLLNYTFTFSMNYATFFGSNVNVQLSNGASF